MKVDTLVFINLVGWGIPQDLHLHLRPYKLGALIQRRRDAAIYEVKNTTKNPTQLPTTPIAEYELVNIKGKNSYLIPNNN